MDDAVVETRAIGKRYGRFEAVSELSLRVERGEIFALVGQNGAGKTTLLKILCGLTPATSGGLELFGESAERGLAKARARTGAMIETPGFLPYLSARENLEYCRIQRGDADRGETDAALRLVGLEGAGRKKFRQFSLGMKQRLGLALAVMDGPELLILDEPINGLDPMGIKEFRDIILKLNREKGTTVLISSHILGELSQIATAYGFIDGGKLVEHIGAQALREKCRSYLRIDVDDAQRASRTLREKLGVTKFAAEGNTLRIDERMDEPAAFVKALVEDGTAVCRVRRAGISLEQYFIGLVGGGKENA